MDTFFSLINIIIFIFVVGGWVLFLVAAWKSMRALQSIAETVREYCNKSSIEQIQQIQDSLKVR